MLSLFGVKEQLNRERAILFVLGRGSCRYGEVLMLIKDQPVMNVSQRYNKARMYF